MYKCVCVERFDIDGNSIAVATCRTCGNQVNVADIPKLPHPQGFKITHQLADIDRFMWNKCCKLPIYDYGIIVWIPD